VVLGVMYVEKTDHMLIDYACTVLRLWHYVTCNMQRLQLATSNLVCSSGLPRTIIKSHPEEKVGLSLAKGAPQILGFPLFINFASSLLLLIVVLSIPNSTSITSTGYFHVLI